jgi:hypothetical protein
VVGFFRRLLIMALPRRLLRLVVPRNVFQRWEVNDSGKVDYIEVSAGCTKQSDTRLFSLLACLGVE